MGEINNRRQLPSVALLLRATIVILVCLFSHLGAIGLVGPDEPRYAWIARAMAETGDWMTPRLYGQPWFEKPVLYYWAAAAGFWLHLPAEWAARLPSALAALAAALAIGWLAWKHYGIDRDDALTSALLAPLLFSTSVAAIGFARAAAPDMLFAASLTLAMASAACVLHNNEALRACAESSLRPGDKSPVFLFGTFLGLAVLAKGPAAIVLAGGAIGLWALATKQWRVSIRLAHPLAILTFCVVALPWYIVCAFRNSDFLRVFLWEHNFERYLTPLYQHRQPFWYFGPIVLLALLPWTILLWPAAQEGLRLRRETDRASSPGLFFVCWAAFPLIFFSFSQSKLPGYALPAIPPLALLCSAAMLRITGKDNFESRLILGGVGITWILVEIASFISLRRMHLTALEGSPSRTAGAIGICGILVAIAMIVLALLRKRSLAIVVCLLFVALSVEVAGLRILPMLDPFYSARSHAALMRNGLHPERIFAYRLRRGWNYGLAFYFHREIPEWSPADREAALVLTTPEGFEEIRRLGRFRGSLDEPYVGIMYVPVQRQPF